MSVYRVVATLEEYDERNWLGFREQFKYYSVEVIGLGVTQAYTRGEVWEMADDYIRLLTDDPFPLLSVRFGDGD